MKSQLCSTCATLLITLAIVAAAAFVVFLVSPPRYSPAPEVKHEEFVPPSGFRHATPAGSPNGVQPDVQAPAR